MAGPDWEKINKAKAEKEVIKEKKLKIGMAYKIAIRSLTGKNFEGEELEKQIIEKTKFYYDVAQKAEQQILQTEEKPAEKKADWQVCEKHNKKFNAAEFNQCFKCNEESKASA